MNCTEKSRPGLLGQQNSGNKDQQVIVVKANKIIVIKINEVIAVTIISYSDKDTSGNDGIRNSKDSTRTTS